MRELASSGNPWGSEALDESPALIQSEVSKAIVGKADKVEAALIALLSGGHLLIEDYPGLAKTLLAKSFAAATGLAFKRVQFTSDLLPADITGSYILNRNSSKFELRKGPVFTNILLADEINRAPPRTQSALLEAMQERQVTVEGETLRLESPFWVVATQNPIEYEGTYPLPEAQLDRFMMKLDLGYPSRDEEVGILARRDARKSDEPQVSPVVSPSALLRMQGEVEDIHVDKALQEYMVEIVEATRSHMDVELGASPRGSLALLKLSKARTYLRRGEFVLPDDVKAVAVYGLSHRLMLKPERWMSGVRPREVISQVLDGVPVPKVD
jgi:MoxR-like ATPase